MTKFETDDFVSKRKQIFEFTKELGIDLDPYLPVLDIYDQLNEEFPVLHRREELQQYTKQIIQAKSLLLNNTHLVISKAITNSLTKVSHTSFPDLQQLGAQLGFAIPQQFFAINAPNSLLDFQSLGKNAKLLIIQNPPDGIRPIFEQNQTKGLGIIFINIVESVDNTSDFLKQLSQNILDFCDEIQIKSDRYFVTYSLPTLDFELSKLDQTLNLVKPIVSWCTSTNNKTYPEKDFPITTKLKKDGGQDGAGQIQDVLKESVNLYTYSNRRVHFQLLASEKQCSDIRFHIIVDEIEIGITDWLGYPDREEQLPLQTEIISIENSQNGEHKLTIQPEGRDGGCNKGFIQQWEATLKLYTW